MEATATSIDNAVTITVSAQEKFAEVRQMLVRAEEWVNEAVDQGDLDSRRFKMRAMEQSFYGNIVHLMMISQNHDGPLQINSDSSPGCFYWSHEKSGYHGGLIFHRNKEDDRIGTWGLHT